MYRIGIDLGGTNIAVGVVDDSNFKIVGEGKVKTNAPRPVEEICDDIVKAVNLALADAKLSLDDVGVIGIGCPGAIDNKNGIITYSNNLEFFNAPITDILYNKLGKKVLVDNDANVAALGEMIAGAGKGCKDFVAITLGTGVGSGVIVDGKMLYGHNGMAGELGHTVIKFDGERCTCGRKGCYEAYASATALIRQTKDRMKKSIDSKMWDIVDGNIDAVNGRTAFDAMRADDVAGTEVVDEYCRYIAVGLINIINTFQPQIICIGGGISKEGDNLLSRINKTVKSEVFTKSDVPQTKIKVATLGNDAGIIGAAMLDTME